MVTTNNRHTVKLRDTDNTGTVALRTALRDVGGWEDKTNKMSPAALRGFAVARIVSNIKDNSGIFPEEIVTGLTRTRRGLLRMGSEKIADNYTRIVDIVNSHKVHVRLLHDGLSRPEISFHEKVRELEELSKITYSNIADALSLRNKSTGKKRSQ